MTVASLVLASASPRRRELLDQIGVEFVCASADIDESVAAGESAEHYVARLAQQKARVVANDFPGSLVLGSDTSVVCDQKILGKPLDREDSIRMLQLLSGRKHQVVTAVALVKKSKKNPQQGAAAAEQVASVVVTTQVLFRALSIAECERYWASGEPLDKAGSYAIQGLGAVFVEQIEGSYSAVVGLPLQQTAELLQQQGIEIWQRR
ncbi:MAG: Maf family protein [Motiliproteus sp.]